MHIDESFDGREVTLQPDQMLEIRLPENRTTGYRWTLTSTNDSTYAVVSDSYEGSATPPGKPGTRILRLKATQAGRGRVELVYRRPWEQTAPPARTFTIYIRVSR